MDIYHMTVLCRSCFVLLCCFATTANSQTVDPRAVPVSKPGQAIGSSSASRFMRIETEKRINEFLVETNDECWQAATVEQLVRKLNLVIPVWLNRDELDLIGIDADSSINTSELPDACNGARLTLLLAPLELTAIMRNDCLEITSKDSADADPVVRVYDVSLLVNAPTTKVAMRRADTMAGGNTFGGHIYGDFDTISNVVQQTIDPDSWLAAGGTSSIMPIIVDGRGFLVFAAPTSTHQKVAALLTTLNASTSSSGKPIIAESYNLNRSQSQNALPRSYLKLNTARVR